jgi:hypothetical protein
MAMIQLGRKYKVFVETDLGAVMEIPVVAFSMTMDASYDSLTTEIQMRCVGSPSWQDNKHFIEQVHEKQNAPEWQCTYCGRPNNKVAEVCKSCGGVRSFIYGV